MVRDFLAVGNEPIRRAGIGVAGPVYGGRATATNLPWNLSEQDLAREFGLDRVRLINDFVAVALGIPSLAVADLAVLQEGRVNPSGPVAVLGAGTGLGEAILLPGESEPTVLATEGGHASFAPTSAREIRLLEFLRSKFGHVSWERVLSGPGIKSIYDFLVADGEPELPATVSRLADEDPGSVIGELALAKSDPTCVAAVDVFARLYGAEAGDLALKSMASGGVFVAGGIAPRLLTILQTGIFTSSFNEKGRMSALMNTFRVSVVMRSDVGLLGACRAGLGEVGFLLAPRQPGAPSPNS